MEAAARALWSVATRLGLCDDDASRLGVLSLLDSIESGDVASWPTTEAIIELEDSLVLHALHLATVSPPTGGKGDDAGTASPAKAERVLRDNYGFTEDEVRSVMALARALALAELPSGEAGRAMAWASLEDGVRRAQEAMDLRSEISFRKLQAMTMGHTRGEGPENEVAEFTAVVRRVSARQDEQLEARHVEALPVPSTRREEVQAVQLDRLEREVPDPLDDPDDLAEFDRENG